MESGGEEETGKPKERKRRLLKVTRMLPHLRPLRSRSLHHIRRIRLHSPLPWNVSTTQMLS